MTNRIFNIEESWKFLGHKYDVIDERTSYSVRLVYPDGAYEFLREPEERFETPAGARYAILLDLEKRFNMETQDALKAIGG